MDEKLIIDEVVLRQIIDEMAGYLADLEEVSPGAFVSNNVFAESSSPGATALAEMIALFPGCVEALRQVFATHIAFLQTVIADFTQADIDAAIAAQELTSVPPTPAPSAQEPPCEPGQ